MKNNEKALQEYMKEVTNEFVNSYVKELDSKIYSMLNAFGYEGDVDEVGEWLEKEGYNLLMDEDKKDNRSTKTIILEEKETHYAVGVFMVEIATDEVTGNLKYGFSDVYIRNLDE